MIALAIGCFGASAGAAQAAVRYASPTGGGTTCSQASPCSITTATAPASVNNGDEIVLGTGTYTAVPEIDILDPNVSLHGESGQPRPTLESTASAVVFSNQSGTSVSHLNIEEGGSGTALFLAAGGGAVEDVVVSSADGNACAFSGNATYNVRSSICWSGGGGDAGVWSPSGSTTLNLRNVTAVSTGSVNAHGIYVSSSAGETKTVAASNVIAIAPATDSPSNDVHASASGTGASATVTLDHSNYDKTFAIGTSGATASVTAAGSGTNQTGAPVFVDLANGNFHEAAGSPTINAGVDNGLNGATDIDDEPRPMGAGTDIGADEFTDTVADADADDIPDAVDNCPSTANADQANADGDSQGNACDTDDDNDTVLDGSDNCPVNANADQANNDVDSQGDACDSDDDNDTVTDASDNCQFVANQNQANSDLDAQGDLCDSDDDNDTVNDGSDNCPVNANADQANLDMDAAGDVCDLDDDGDGVDDTGDNCPRDTPGDQANLDGDAEGDLCDPDDDNDGLVDAADDCPAGALSGTDTDGDGCKDTEDLDDDDDTVLDDADNCPVDVNADQADADGDGIGAVCDPSDSPPTPPTNPQVDRDPPETSIAKGPAKRTTKAKAKFTLAADEAGSRFECKLDRKALKPCASPARFRNLKAGKHKLLVQAIDRAGNVDQSPAKYSWKVIPEG